LEELRAQHNVKVVGSNEEAYGVINADPKVMEYGPTFQLLHVRTSLLMYSLLGHAWSTSR
jgi:hypothetical protein